MDPLDYVLYGLIAWPALGIVLVRTVKWRTEHEYPPRAYNVGFGLYLIGLMNTRADTRLEAYCRRHIIIVLALPLRPILPRLYNMLFWPSDLAMYELYRQYAKSQDDRVRSI